MSVTAEQREQWQKMSAPSLRKVVKEKHGDALNGGLMVAKKGEMIELLCGEIQPSRLLSRLKMRITRRRNVSDSQVAHHRKSRVASSPVARVTRRAASPIPPPLPASVQAHVNGIATKLALASKLAEVPAVQDATADQLRDAVEALVSIRG